jgi:hypothetical protein
MESQAGRDTRLPLDYLAQDNVSVRRIEFSTTVV